MSLGAHICRMISLNSTIALTGNLGCGKTTFVKGMARALGIDPKKVNSPSYVLIKEYDFKEGRLFHMDLYRLDGIKEIASLGMEEYFNYKGLLVIEWAQKAKELMPDDYIQINIKAPSEYRRRFTVCVKGKKYNNLLSSFKRAVMSDKL